MVEQSVNAAKPGIKDDNGAAFCLQPRGTGVRPDAGQVISKGAVRASASLQAAVLLFCCVI